MFFVKGAAGFAESLHGCQGCRRRRRCSASSTKTRGVAHAILAMNLGPTKCTFCQFHCFVLFFCFSLFDLQHLYRNHSGSVCLKQQKKREERWCEVDGTDTQFWFVFLNSGEECVRRRSRRRTWIFFIFFTSVLHFLFLFWYFVWLLKIYTLFVVKTTSRSFVFDIHSALRFLTILI